MCKLTKNAIALIGTLCFVFSFLGAQSAAQEQKTAFAPDFSGTISLNVGAENLGGNVELAQIPGLTSNSDLVLDLNLKGGVFLPSIWQVQRENDIDTYSGIGYEAGIRANLANLYDFTNASSSYTLSNSNGYSRIQLMIDWYEANKTRFGLPSNPFGSAGWPTTSYGGDVGRYQFIIGTQVERADDVAWSNRKWADAFALYNDVNAKIENAIDMLSSEILSTGDVNQYIFDGLSAADQKKAINKQQALKSYKSTVFGSNTSMSVDGPHVSAAWLTVNNIFSVMDIRLDFLGARLSNGTMLKSSLAAQSRSGSAATFSLVNTVLPGLSFSLAAGIAGGIAQKPENYDTIALDYYPGMPSEFGVQAKAGWNQYFTPLNSDLTASLEFIMPDLLVEMTNFAGGASLGWNTVGFISVNTLFEAQVVSWADRLVEGDKPELSMAFANKTSARVFGVSPEIQVQWKSAGFSSRNKNRVENRYAGITAKDDFDSVHLNSAFLLKAGFDFNPAYFLYKDIVNLHVEAEGFLVDFDLYGLGWNGKVDVDLYDFTRIPLQLDGSVSYYKNEKLPVFADMNNLPERMFIDYLTWSAGLTFKPIKDITFMLNYNSKPSVSRRQSIRESSILFSTKITF